MTKNYLTPAEITEHTIVVGAAKVRRRPLVVLLMAIMAGMYIAMGALVASTAAHAVTNSGLAKVVAGAVFPIGLMFVLMNGADLFTGNCLIAVSAMDRRITWGDFGRSLAIVWAGNFVGAVVVARMEAYSGMFGLSNGLFGAYTVATAVAKVNLGFGQAFVLGIICNLFVCAGVWMSYAAVDAAGKLLAAFFTVLAFVISGSEHIVANMYYVSAGIFAKGTQLYAELAGLGEGQLAGLTWKGFLLRNAIPVTLGNVVGGVMIGFMYHMVFRRLPEAPHDPAR